jgi:hypothetical protein
MATAEPTELTSLQRALAAAIVRRIRAERSLAPAVAQATATSEAA